jgi:hypothetical protein
MMAQMTFGMWLSRQRMRSDATGWLSRQAGTHAGSNSADALLWSMLREGAPDEAWQVLYQAIDEWRQDAADPYELPSWV